LNEYKNEKDLTFWLRPHPGDKNFENWKNLAKKFRVNFSNSKCENTNEFLQKVDAIIAGETNIHLEAVITNVLPIYYNFSGQSLRDHYGFIKNNLVENIAYNLKDLNKIFINLKSVKPNVRYKAKYYSSSINTKYDGRSVLLISELLHKLQNNEEINPDNWEKIKSLKNLVAYKLHQ